MAGESPDRSKQRESSAEPTSGSAGPVPGARDPRLAVARESISLGGVDTATKVFSVRELPKDPEKAEEAPTEAGATTSDPGDPEPTDSAPERAPEASEDSDESGDESTTTGDARLRAAVAAWVSTGDEPTESDEGGADGTADGAKDDSSEAEDTATEDATDTETPEAESADEEPAEASTEDEPAPGEPEAVDDDADGDVTDAETDVEDAAGEPEAEAQATDAAETDVTDETPEEDEEDRPDTGDSDPPGARGTARSTPTDPQPTDDKAGQQDDEADEADSPQDDDQPRVDQPTAVFKAPRPPVDQPTTMLKLGKATAAPAKDTEDAKAGEEAKASPQPPPTPEAERTSKFVALKPLDTPRPKPDVTAAVPQLGPERTTQQPLPPKPPLDLLAELTNTPPPPPSPLRTLGRRVKIWTPLVLLLIVAFAIAQTVRPLPTPTLTLTAEDSYTFDGSKAALPWPGEGQGWMDVNGIGTMGDFGKQTPVAIGSVAKAMTAYIVLKDHPLKSGEEGAKITVDALAEKEGGYNKDGESTLNTVKAGDVLTEKQAISAIMIPSANNIARLLARWDAGSEAAFIKKMNDTAKELGMTNTTYTDASGLKETTVSSAEDQVKLGNELVKIQALMDITSMGQWIDPSGQKWYNYNYLLPANGSIGIKTGTTTAAGGNLLFAARKEVGGETVTVVGAILGQHTSPIIKTVNDVSRVALIAAREELASAKILKKGDVVGYVDDGLGGHTPVVLTKDVTAVGWAGLKVKLSFAADDVPHTAKAGTKVGTLTVGDGDEGAVTVPVTLQKDLAEPGFADKLTRLG